jgi:Ni,Fe-hydrogenase III small subunit/formate hydrogenlyase subunit 6/NADH:ubiquinone oxidoreductase subunit I
MFDILRKSLATGVVTTDYPETPRSAEQCAGRGCPKIDFANWKDVRPAVAACPTGALASSDRGGIRTATFDLGKCTYCGLCAEADPAIQMTSACELAATRREDLITTASYELNRDATQRQWLAPAGSAGQERAGEGRPPIPGSASAESEASIDAVGAQLKKRIDKVLGRSLHIREVDAGSCNGCEVEIVGLGSPVYDIERFGIHFVASPRHADMLLVTGPVSRNMELALRKTFDATPEPRLVVAVGACGCSGGIFGRNYASLGGVDKVIPVDAYVPGCPPNPHALLHGVLTAIGRLPSEQ